MKQSKNDKLLGWTRDNEVRSLIFKLILKNTMLVSVVGLFRYLNMSLELRNEFNCDVDFKSNNTQPRTYLDNKDNSYSLNSYVFGGLLFVVLRTHQVNFASVLGRPTLTDLILFYSFLQEKNIIYKI